MSTFTCSDFRKWMKYADENIGKSSIGFNFLQASDDVFRKDALYGYLILIYSTPREHYQQISCFIILFFLGRSKKRILFLLKPTYERLQLYKVVENLEGDSENQTEFESTVNKQTFKLLSNGRVESQPLQFNTKSVVNSKL